MSECYSCGATNSTENSRCQSCRRLQWEEWDAKDYLNPFYGFSSGRSKIGRIIGNAVLAVWLICVAYGVAGIAFAKVAPFASQRVLAASAISGYIVFEVWAYFHGRAMFVDMYLAKNIPANTSVRTIGVALETVLLSYFIYELVHGKAA